MRCAILLVLDADRTAAIEQDARGERIRHDREIAALARGREIPARRRPATALARGELEIAGAFLAGAVEIGGARDARLTARRDERLAQRMRLAHIADGERTADAVQLVLAALL